MNITITIEWMTVVRVACGVTWLMTLHYIFWHETDESK